MKKLLSILASLTLTASASAAVVSCAGTSASTTANDYANNDYGNMMAASLEKAKAVILNNEHHVSQSFVAKEQNNFKVSDQGLSGINYDDLGSKNATVAQLVNKYYGSTPVNDNTNTGMETGSENGETNTLNVLINTLMDKFPGQYNWLIRSLLINGKDKIVKGLNAGLSEITAANFDQFNNQMYLQANNSPAWGINSGITVGISKVNDMLNAEKPDESTTIDKVAAMIVNIVNQKETFTNSTIPTFFNSDQVNLVRNIATALLSSTDGISPLQKAVYENTDLTIPELGKGSLQNYISSFDGFTPKKIADVNVQDIKDELASSAYRIATTVLNPTVLKLVDAIGPKLGFDYPSDKDYNGQINKLENLTAVVIASLANGTIDGSQLFNANLGNNEQAILGLVWEALRDVTLMNAQFTLYEASNKITINDSKKLFDNEKPSYEFMNSLYGKKLSETSFFKIQDEPINLAYFFANLDYYLGGITTKKDDAIYKLQKFLFIVFNDPFDNGGQPPLSKGWADKDSRLLDFITYTGLKFANLAVFSDSSDANKTIRSVLSKVDDATIKSLQRAILKPLVLGLINGDSIQNILEPVVNTIETLYKVDSNFATLLDALKVKGIDIRKVFNSLNSLVFRYKIGNDTIHKLFINDYRKEVEELGFVPQEWIDKLFGTKEINLTTLFNMPIYNLLSIAGIDGFKGGRISSIADYITTNSIPWVAQELDKFFNGANDGKTISTDYLVLRKDGETPDYSKSIKSRDINFGAIYDLLISIIGTKDEVDQAKTDAANKGKGPKDKKVTFYKKPSNIFSRLLNDAIKSKDGGVSITYPKTKDGKDDTSNPIVRDLNKLTLQIDPTKFVNDLGLQKSVVKSEQKWDDSDPKPDSIFKSFKETWIGKFMNADDETPDQPGDNPDDEPDSGKDGDALQDLIIDKNSLSGSLYRLFLPEIDQKNSGAYDAATPTQFTMHDKYLETDLLQHSYANLVSVVNWLNTPGQYGMFVEEMLNNSTAFQFELIQDSMRYFREDPLLIKGFEYRVTYRNYVAGEKSQYVFTVSRNTNIEGFKITKVVTDKNY